MRPIKLVISAFGPYKGLVKIDFSKFNSNDIFLITGDTGSGKTTIFDAMVFALFGEASGSRRDNSSFRSDFADDDVDTYIEFSFMHKDILYNIKRTPSYYRKKKRGNGTTKTVGDASLIYLDKVITGDKLVSEKCVSILGMTSSQFKQIVMIAQGEFLDLLFAKTKDRAAIFRRIFDTSIYKSISENLKAKYLEKRREFEDSFLNINGYIQGVMLDGDIENKSTDEVIALLNKELCKDEELEKNRLKEKKEKMELSSKIVKIISEGQIINNSIISLKENKEKLSIFKKKNEDIKKLEEKISKNENIWNKILPKYDICNDLNKEIILKQSDMKKNKENIQQITKDYNKISLKYKNIDKSLKLIQDYNKEKEVINNNISKLKKQEELEKLLHEFNNKLNLIKLKDKKEILNQFIICKEKSEYISKLKDKINSLKNLYMLSNKEYLEKYDLFISAQAGVLASNLFDGNPCPVCGSLEHPNKAKLVETVLSKEELDSLKIELDKKYQELESLRVELTINNHEIKKIEYELSIYNEDNIRDEINNIELDLDNNLNNINIDDINTEELKVNIKRLELEIEESKSNINDETVDSLIFKVNKVNDNIKKIETEINKIKKDYEIILKEKIRLETLDDSLKNDIESLNSKYKLVYDDYINEYKKYGYRNDDDYIKDKLDMEEISIIKESVDDYYKEIIEIKSNIKNLEKIIDNHQYIDLDNYNKELDLVNEDIKNIDMYLKNINIKISNNKKIYDKLNDVSKKVKKLEHEVMIYKDLSDTANGTITGKNKMEFEQYVQAGYFDNVLIAANKRFEYMTDNRYKLFRKEESLKISDKLGLELEVMDYYTGKKRDIKSLSGGEAFKASLSLALGMSDTIQEYAGGVVVDAMFIDEGFGSLDDESLESAMNAIMMLSNSNKLIGIISHVNELKMRIDKKIIINKGNNGSSVKISI